VNLNVRGLDAEHAGAESAVQCPGSDKVKVDGRVQVHVQVKVKVNV